MTVKNMWLMVVFLLFISACKADNIDYKGMDSSETAFNEEQRKVLLAYMPLKTIYPDERVRALAEAAGNGDLKKIEALIADGTNVNSQGAKNVTPLFWGLRNIDGFEKLLELGANPNSIFAGSSIMHWTVKHKNTEFLRVALQHGGNPNLVAGKLGESPIFKAIGVKGSDNRPAMLILLDSGADINFSPVGEKILGMSMGGITPVLVAADLGRFDVVYELLLRGADYRAIDDSNQNLQSRVDFFNGGYVEGSNEEKSLNQVIEWLSKK